MGSDLDFYFGGMKFDVLDANCIPYHLWWFGVPENTRYKVILLHLRQVKGGIFHFLINLSYGMPRYPGDDRHF